MPELLQLESVSKSYSGLMAVNRVSMDVQPGEILGLIGPNGAGKTTLFNIVAGSVRPDSGRILFEERDITRRSASQRCKLGIARSFQLVRPFPDLTVLANVAVGRVYGRNSVWSRRRAEADAMRHLERVGLADRAEVHAKHLTLVDRKRLELARALATNPTLLLLDEMVAGLNPTEVLQAMDLIRELRASGITIVMVEHVMSAIFGLSDRIVVMNAGERIAEGTPEEVTNNQHVIDAYLGAGHGHAA